MNEEHTWTGNSEVDAAIIMLDRIDCSPEYDSRVDAVEATLRRLHARIQELEAMLEAPQPQADALDAAEPDTTRLNFMLHTNAAVHSVALGWALKFGDCHWQEGTYGTARDAIDAAIAEKENK